LEFFLNIAHSQVNPSDPRYQLVGTEGGFICSGWHAPLPIDESDPAFETAEWGSRLWQSLHFTSRNRWRCQFGLRSRVRVLLYATSLSDGKNYDHFQITSSAIAGDRFLCVYSSNSAKLVT
jgi:hypothetical protein